MINAFVFAASTHFMICVCRYFDMTNLYEVYMRSSYGITCYAKVVTDGTIICSNKWCFLNLGRFDKATDKFQFKISLG